MAGFPIGERRDKGLTGQVREPTREALRLRIDELTYELADSQKRLKQARQARKQAEISANLAKSKSKESSLLFETVLNAIPDILLVQSLNHDIVYYNTFGYQYVNKIPQEVVGRKCFEIMGFDRPCEPCVAARAIETRRMARLEKFFESTGGWLDARAYPIIDDKDTVIGAIEHLRDISAEKHEKEALRQSECRYRKLVETMSEGLIMTDADFSFTFVNQRFCSMIGFAADELIGTRVLEFVDADSKGLMQAQMIQSNPGTENRYELAWRTKDGLKLYTLISCNGFYDSLGRLTASLCVLTDITGMKLKEKQQRELEMQLQQSQKLEAIGTLAGGVAHDFNNLLMAIQGHASLILKDMDSGHRNYGRIKRIDECVQSGAKLSKQLLGFARSSKCDVIPVNINAIVARTASLFGRAHKTNTVHENYRKNIWTIDADPGKLEQVLLNFCVNAWQAMPDGGNLFLETDNVVLGADDVRRFSVKPGRYVKVSVKDTGVGMDQATRRRLFEPFFTTKKRGMGTGLGLATAFNIVKNHKGFIDVRSKYGQGSTFIIFLPASDKEIVESQSCSEVLHNGSETILLVDDEEKIIEVCSEMLKALGYDFLTGLGGKTAVDIYKNNMDQIDMVILDMVMPEMDGAQTYREIKTINPDVRVLLSSGYSIDGRSADILSFGRNGFIQKPFNIHQLSQKIRQVLDL